MKPIVAVLACSIIIASCGRGNSGSDKPLAPPANNVLTADEISEGWQLLFDGSTLNGWKRFNADSIGPLWSVREGEIVCDGKGLTEGTAGTGGSLLTIKSWANFEFDFDWKLSPGGNSGVLYHVQDGKAHSHEYETGPEYQLIDDEGWKGDPLRDPQKAGSNYDVYAALAEKKINAPGEWNSSKLIYNNGHVQQWLNGAKVVEFDESSDDFKQRVARSKWKGYPDWNKIKTGSIALQDHGAPVFFRNLKIKELQ